MRYKVHQLKIKKEYYASVVRGTKRFELRKNDRDYKVEDLIHFVKTNGEEFGGDEDTNLYEIVYILTDCKSHGLEDGYCILGIQRYYIPF